MYECLFMYTTPRSAAGTPCSAADMPRSAANTLHQQILKIFKSVFSFSRGKKHFFQEVHKKWSSIQKNIFITFQGGVVGSDPKMIKITSLTNNYFPISTFSPFFCSNFICRSHFTIRHSTNDEDLLKYFCSRFRPIRRMNSKLFHWIG